ncbi:Elongator subunit elp4 [Entomophthora muscae]|uniref:Elongator subunit elp4 n=1 Tax=Entomophthora muscae TaxID=34485 RepID=A0ACC2UFW3_9FUNG|nr:Elongator subunit elp4 [Entomophthora muscae]
MSSFKRNIQPGKINSPENKNPSVARAPSAVALPKGTKLSPHHTQLLLTSTGISSLDGVIGGGLPIGTLGLVITDQCTSYARTALSYYISQGIMHQHEIAVIAASEELNVDGGSLKWLDSLPGPFKVSSSSSEAPVKRAEDLASSNDSLTIAWRYKNLPKINSGVYEALKKANKPWFYYCLYQACVELRARKLMHWYLGPQILSASGVVPYCHTFDLTSPLSDEIKKETPIEVVLLNQESSDLYYSLALEKIKKIIEEGGA